MDVASGARGQGHGCGQEQGVPRSSGDRQVGCGAGRLATGRSPDVGAPGRHDRSVQDMRDPAAVPPVHAALTVLQLTAAVWLLVSPFVLAGPNPLATAKDVVAGAMLLVVTIGACVVGGVRRVEARVCLAVGVLLVGGALVLDVGPGSTAPARQWNEVVVGVVLICTSTARVR